MLGLVVAAAAQLRHQQQPPSTQLRLQVSTDRQSYKLADSLQLDAQLVNTGEEDVYIYTWDLCWNAFRGLSLHLISSDDSAARGHVLLDCVPPPPDPRDVYQFVRLEPRRVYGLMDTFKVRDVVSKPGDYRLQVTFSGSLSRDWIHESMATVPIATLPLWTMERPPLKSNTIQLTITR
ncbi:MAG TPA: hypothetical protein VJV22_14115 [Acidobacteriaceae bacterium]|nr:hypothetical protein [Acidobacteriaceae bacterium]